MNSKTTPFLLGDLYPVEFDTRDGWYRDWVRANAIYRWRDADLLGGADLRRLRARFARYGVHVLHLHRIGEPLGPSEVLLGNRRAHAWRRRFDTSWRSITIVVDVGRVDWMGALALYLIAQGWSRGVVRLVTGRRPEVDEGARYPNPSRWFAPDRRDLARLLDAVERDYDLTGNLPLEVRLARASARTRLSIDALVEGAALVRYLRWRGIEFVLDDVTPRPRWYFPWARARARTVRRRVDEESSQSAGLVHTAGPVPRHLLRSRAVAAVLARHGQTAYHPHHPLRRPDGESNVQRR